MVLLLLGCTDIAFHIGGKGDDDGPPPDDTAAVDTSPDDTGDDTAPDSADDTAPDSTGDTSGDSADDTSVDTGTDYPDLSTWYTQGAVVAASAYLYVSWLSVVDLNGDGLMDVVASATGDWKWTPKERWHDLEVLLSDGAGGYTAEAVPLGVLSTGTLPHAVADLDGDGRPDVAVGHADGLSWLRWDGAAFVDRVDVPSDRFAAVAAGDVDEDGDQDLVALASNEAVVWRNDGSGGLTEAARYLTRHGEITEGYNARILLADVDTDGHLDLVTLGEPMRTPNHQVNLGAGDGTFGAGTADMTALSWAYDLVVGDLDGDSVHEVGLVSAHGTLAVSEWSGTWGTPRVYSLGYDLFSWIVPGDPDGDGDLDLLGTSLFQAAVLEQAHGLVWRARFPVCYHGVSAPPAARTMVTGDVNADGCDDIVVFDYGEGYRVAPSRARGCDGFGFGTDARSLTGAEPVAAPGGAGVEAGRTCATADGRAAGALGALLGALAIRRRRA